MLSTAHVDLAAALYTADSTGKQIDLATAERRIMITFNVKDFPRIAVEWAAAGKHHAGCLIVVGIDHSEFGRVLRVIDAALTARPDQTAWQDFTAWGTRRSAP